MKKSIIAFLVIITAFSVNAQKNGKNLQFSFGLDFGKPVGTNSKTSAFVIGGDLQGEYMASANFGLTLSAGLDARINRGGVVNTYNYAPILGGFRYAVSEKFYISEQAGYSIGVSKNTKGAFTDVTGFGFKPSAKSDVLLAYKGLFYSKPDNTVTKTYSTIDLRLAFSLNMKK